MISPAHPPEFQWSPSPSPAQPPSLFSAAQQAPPLSSSKQQPIDFSPPLIAMVVIAAAAFLIVTYSRLISRHFMPPLIRQVRRYRRWRRRRQLLGSSGAAASDTESPPYAASELYSPYGLDESVIKSMPLSVYSEKERLKGGASLDDFSGDCAVCLLEFLDKDYVRTLPLCAHSFHVDCIDVWLRSHASCPLCRAAIMPRDWPFLPVMAARIRPSIDDTLFFESRRSDSVSSTLVPEIVESEASRRSIQSEPRPGMGLKRSYSFGFERNFASSTSPWGRYHNRRGSFSFWRRPSPFYKPPRVFSFRSSRGMKSPFFGRRRGPAFVPLSESASIGYAHYYSSSAGVGFGAGSSRRSKSMASPIFGRSAAAAFSSSRMRCGDPEALISPERYGSR